MSLLEDARRLADSDPTFEDDGYVGLGRDICVFCSAWKPDHKPDCPWLAMPKIVAVLEAAERSSPPVVLLAHGDMARTTQFACCWSGIDREHRIDCWYVALVAALKGEAK